MRQLIDNYVDAEDSRKVSFFDDLTLVELIVKSGISTVINNFPQRSEEKTMKSFQKILVQTLEN